MPTGTSICSIPQMHNLLNLIVFLLWSATLQGQTNSFFSQNKNWRGGDGAASIPLGNGKVLWLFGDSFISTDTSGCRTHSTLVRNSIGIQEGLYMKKGTLKFYWGESDQKPTSFFIRNDSNWYWPGHGMMIKDRLIVFLMNIHKTDSGLGFEAIGWDAVLIENPTEDPLNWKMKFITGANPYKTIAGSAAIIKDSKYLYAYGVVEPSTHEVHLMRWTLDDAYSGNLNDPEYWSNDKWIAQKEMHNPPDVLFIGGTEFSVHYDRKLKKYIQVQSFGFGEAVIGIRMSGKPEGKWSEPLIIHRPDYAGIKKPFMYSAKAHPEQKGKKLCITYNINSFDFNELLNNQEIYFPKVIWLNLKGLKPIQ